MPSAPNDATPVDGMSASARHIPALDGIRGLAILLVIAHNADLLSSPVPHFFYPYSLLSQAGWMGVQLFFVLSGFLITGQLLDNRRSQHYYRNFYARRALRIFPVYYVFLLVTLLVLPLLGSFPPKFTASVAHQVWLWTFLCNWTIPIVGEVYGFSHFWSLAVEEQFYLVWPALVRRITPRGLLILCFALVIAALAIRMGMRVLGASSQTVYMFTICRMDALAAGAAIAVLLRLPGAIGAVGKNQRWIGWSFPALLALGFLGAHGYQADTFSSETFGQTILALAFAALILSVVATPFFARGLFSRPLQLRALRSVGKYSYAMYIFHFPLHLLVGRPPLAAHGVNLGNAGAVLYTATIGVVSYLLARISYIVLESPFLRMKRAFAS